MPVDIIVPGLKGVQHMRRIKLAIIPVAVAAVELLGPAAAQGNFRLK